MSAEEQLRIATRQGPDRLIFELVGELDMASAASLRDAVGDARGVDVGVVVLDLRGLSFLDSTGLKAIFAARSVVIERSQRFAVTPGSAAVQRLLSLTRLDEHLETIETPDAVLA
jgi:anti-anti-sigma factor